MAFKRLADIDCKGRTVVIREDLNVPMKDGKIGNDKRVRAALPTIQLALDKGAGVVVLSHLGRPTEGEFEEKFSLKPVAEHLGKLLGKPVTVVDEIEKARPAPGEVVLLENIRFFKGEKKNDDTLAAKLANLGDVYVMDAFGSAHRAHASTDGAVRKAKIGAAGPLMEAELEAFDKVLKNPAKPLAAIIGGSKVSTKLALLDNLLGKVDILIVGGGMANTFLAASGLDVGKSLQEPELHAQAREIMEKAEKLGVKLVLPIDVVTAKELAPGQEAHVHDIKDVPADEMILDVGPRTIELYEKVLAPAKTIVWNGPVGAFETEPFGKGTKELGKFLADSDAFVVVGGGDSVAAVEEYGLADKMGYISTGGGASLELLEGKILPSVAALDSRAAN